MVSETAKTLDRIRQWVRDERAAGRDTDQLHMVEFLLRLLDRG